MLEKSVQEYVNVHFSRSILNILTVHTQNDNYCGNHLPTYTFIKSSHYMPSSYTLLFIHYISVRLGRKRNFKHASLVKYYINTNIAQIHYFELKSGNLYISALNFNQTTAEFE